MLDHPIVDVALGLILLYTVLSLFASVVKEWISTRLRLRAKNLENWIQTLIGADYAAKLYDHLLVSTLATEKKLSSYIGSATFASARVDLLAHGEDDQSTDDLADLAGSPQRLLDRASVVVRLGGRTEVALASGEDDELAGAGDVAAATVALGLLWFTGSFFNWGGPGGFAGCSRG